MSIERIKADLSSAVAAQREHIGDMISRKISPHEVQRQTIRLADITVPEDVYDLPKVNDHVASAVRKVATDYLAITHPHMKVYKAHVLQYFSAHWVKPYVDVADVELSVRKKWFGRF